MKKLLALAILSCVLLGGCSNKNDSSQSDDTTSAADTSVTSSDRSEADNSTTSNEENTPTADVDVTALFETITTAGEWPSMYSPDETEFSDYFGFDSVDSRFKTVQGSFCPMSAILTEVLIIVPQEGNEQAASDLLNERKELLIEKYAYYPSDKELAENAKVGNVGNVYYLICAQSAEDAEKALFDKLNS